VRGVTRDKLLDKLSKLLALETSPNAHEAQSARKQAERFMLRHGLSRDDVRSRDVGYHEVVLPGSGWRVHWRFVLATAAARSYGAEAVAGEREVRIVGEHADVVRAAKRCRRLLRLIRELEGIAVQYLEDRPDVAHALARRNLLRKLRDTSLRTGMARGVSAVLLKRSRRDAAGASSSMAEGPATSLVAVSEGSGKDHSTRVSSRYHPEVVDVGSGLDESWEVFGMLIARDNLVAFSSGEIQVRRPR